MATILDSTKQRVVELMNQTVPDEGPKAMPLVLNFDANTTDIIISLLNSQQQQKLATVQCLYIDLSGSANPMEIIADGSSLRIIAMPNTQGYYTILAPNPVSLKFRMALGSGVQTVYLLNVAIAGNVWAATAF